MSAQPEQDHIMRIALDDTLYYATDLTKLSTEQAIRLLYLRKMHRARVDISGLATGVKERHQQLHQLHRLTQLVNKQRKQEPGDDRGMLELTHPELQNEQPKLAHELTQEIERHTKPETQPDGSVKQVLNLEGRDKQALWGLLKDAGAAGLLYNPLKVHYSGDELQELTDSVQALTGIKDAETWGKVRNIYELRTLLDEARERHKLEFKWPVDSMTREDVEALIAAIDMSCKELMLSNDLDLQELRKMYDEYLEIIQMARAILKTLHDDKLHKARNAGGR